MGGPLSTSPTSAMSAFHPSFNTDGTMKHCVFARSAPPVYYSLNTDERLNFHCSRWLAWMRSHCESLQQETAFSEKQKYVAGFFSTFSSNFRLLLKVLTGWILFCLYCFASLLEHDCDESFDSTIKSDENSARRVVSLACCC